MPITNTLLPNNATLQRKSSQEIRACANAGRREVVFIETDMVDYRTLADGVRPGVEVVLLDAFRDGLTQMVKWARTHVGYDAIHIISQGADGQIKLGALRLNSQTEAQRVVNLMGLSAALTQGGDLLLYGRNVAQGEEGREFITDPAVTLIDQWRVF
jgi:hypothetical protein